MACRRAASCIGADGICQHQYYGFSRYRNAVVVSTSVSKQCPKLIQSCPTAQLLVSPQNLRSATSELSENKVIFVIDTKAKRLSKYRVSVRQWLQSSKSDWSFPSDQIRSAMRILESLISSCLSRVILLCRMDLDGGQLVEFAPERLADSINSEHFGKRKDLLLERASIERLGDTSAITKEVLGIRR